MTFKERFLAVVDHDTSDEIPVDIMGFHEAFLTRLRDYLHVDTQEEVFLKLDIGFRWITSFLGGGKEYYSGPLSKSVFSDSNLGYWGTTLSYDQAISSSETILRGMPYGDSLSFRPLQKVSSIKDVENYLWPNPQYFDYQTIVDECKKYQGFVVRAGGGPLFNRVCQLAGMETTLQNLLLRPKIVEAITRRITEFYYQAFRRFLTMASEYVDEFYFWDDVATDHTLFFNIKLWRKFFKGPLARIFSLAKDFDLKMHYHCCGAMSELIPDLIEIGMDILEPCQFHLPGMEPKRLKREFGRYMTFYGGINTQKTLPFGTPKQVRQEVRERIDVVGKGGGYILAPDHTIEPDVPVINILAMCEEAKS